MSWMLTVSGNKFHPDEPETLKVDIADIAHGLSHICRFGGQTRMFYCVAQHSLIVSRIMQADGHSAREQLQGLLHDSTEAYLIDLPQPIKRLPEMRPYRKLEEKLERVIAEKFGFMRLMTPAVKVADEIALATEARDLMGDPQDWHHIKGVRRLEKKILPLDSFEAHRQFLVRFKQLEEAVCG